MLRGYYTRSCVGRHMIIPRSLLIHTHNVLVYFGNIYIRDNAKQQQGAKIFSQIEENILSSSVLNCWSIEAVRKLIRCGK